MLGPPAGDPPWWKRTVLITMFTWRAVRCAHYHAEAGAGAARIASGRMGKAARAFRFGTTWRGINHHAIPAMFVIQVENRGLANLDR